jgi:hypothetical protein
MDSQVTGLESGLQPYASCQLPRHAAWAMTLWLMLEADHAPLMDDAA